MAVGVRRAFELSPSLSRRLTVSKHPLAPPYGHEQAHDHHRERYDEEQVHIAPARRLRAAQIADMGWGAVVESGRHSTNV